MAHIKKNDIVQILSGKDKGKKGEVVEILSKKGKVRVKGVAIATRHVKARANKPSSMIKSEAFIPLSKVKLVSQA